MTVLSGREGQWKASCLWEAAGSRIGRIRIEAESGGRRTVLLN
jgi:hypothetical protein